MAAKLIDITGKRFSSLTVLEFTEVRDKKNERLWKCLCDCGTYTYTTGSKLRNGNTKSCGCLKNIGHSNLTQQEFLDRATLTHGDKYSYSLSVYTKCTDKVTIICNEHGEFKQRPNDHSYGHGCPVCSKGGYKNNLDGTVYLLYSGDITKVGITNKTISKRITELNRRSGYDFELFKSYTNVDGSRAKTIETNLLDYLRTNFNRVSGKFHGSSECFVNVNRDELERLFDTEVDNVTKN